MPVRLDSRSADFAQQFPRFLATKREVSADTERVTRAIVDDVATRGDIALIEATRKFDRFDLKPGGLRITPAEIDAAVRACDTETLDALGLARDRVELFHGGPRQTTNASPMRWASGLARAVARSMPRVVMGRVGQRATRRRGRCIR